MKCAKLFHVCRSAVPLLTVTALAGDFSLAEFGTGSKPPDLTGGPFALSGWEALPAAEVFAGGGYAASVTVGVSPGVSEAPVPVLTAKLTPSGLRLHWTPDGTALVLESRPDLKAGGEWQPVPGEVAAGDVTLTNGGELQFFRLRRQ